MKMCVKTVMAMAKKKSDAKKYYAVTLSGQGDTEITIVDQEVWDWAMNGGDIPKSLWDQIEKEIIEEWDASRPGLADEISERREDMEKDGRKGTYGGENDRALSLRGSIIDGEEATFTSVSEFARFIRKKGIDIEEEYEGYIY